MPPDFGPCRRATTNGLDMAYYEAGEGPAVLLLHGFPELAFSWRHQMRALSVQGWRAIAPDLRGFGETGPHGGLSDYAMRNLALDVVGLLDALGIPRAVIVGHDFGGVLAWTLGRDHRERVAGVISLNTPYTRRGERDLVSSIIAHKGAENYMVEFQRPGHAEAVLGRDIAATFRAMMRRPAVPLDIFRRDFSKFSALPMRLLFGDERPQGAPLLSEEELQFYVAAYRKTGFTGGLNWYRNLRQNWQDSQDSDDMVHVPALMVSAADDYFLPPDSTRGMEDHVPDLERHIIPDCGHWVQHEAAEEVNRIMLQWLERRMRSETARSR